MYIVNPIKYPSTLVVVSPVPCHGPIPKAHLPRRLKTAVLSAAKAPAPALQEERISAWS